MSDGCRCSGGRCGAESGQFNRRHFMGRVAVGTGALAVGSQMAWADEQSDAALLKPVSRGSRRSYPRTPPRVYRGKHLEAVGMPIGGIGTGTIWLDGQGRLGVWQIFNNLSEPRVPDSFFAVRASAADGQAVTRVLQTAAEAQLPPVESLEYEGGYPIARLTFNDAELPVAVRLEAFNPMIPLDAAGSSIPTAVFRFTASNPGSKAAEVTLLGTLQNAVGSSGSGAGLRWGGFGANRNRPLERGSLRGVSMDRLPEPVPMGPVKIRRTSGAEVDGPPMQWLWGGAGITTDLAKNLAELAAAGGVALIDGAGQKFFDDLAKIRLGQRDFNAVATVFEDFERDDFEGWTITGTAFGTKPSHGTEAGQQAVSGFMGHGLVNTYVHGDQPQGKATSKTFVIERRYIGFLIGGGSKAGKTCVNLVVDGKVVRTATGKNLEALEPAAWDVHDLKGKPAVIEIVDHSSDSWGHVNVDQIIFSDAPPEQLLDRHSDLFKAANAITLEFSGAADATRQEQVPLTLSEHIPPGVKAAAGVWRVGRYTKLSGFNTGTLGYEALASAANGDPLVIKGRLGEKGHIILVTTHGLPWSWGSALLMDARGTRLAADEKIVPGHPGWGTMALAAQAPEAVMLPAWRSADDLAAFLADPVQKASRAEVVSKRGETINAAVAVPFTLEPGQSRTVVFTLAWHFPNGVHWGHQGNLYSRRWGNAADVASYVAENLPVLWDRTVLYHETLYESNLPEEFIDAMSSQSVIFRGPTCFWSEAGYFGGYEGSYGCCPLNCTHVWNYAQSHARLFPTLGQNMRDSNFNKYLHPDGETSHREHDKHNAFTDGHCACIEAAYREYQLSPDDRFLKSVWSGVKQAVDWLIEKIDPNHDGMLVGLQPNTYDTNVSGANTFIGSQYLSALAAAERMALAMNEPQTAARWQAVRRAGMANQDAKLYNGEYYIQIPGPVHAEDYDTGCHADQLLGQWWAHMLDLGYLYPAERVKSSLAAIMKYNFREKFAGFTQVPRRYIPDDEGGLLICTWPAGGRPKPFILYADEVWTGIEYAVAGAMVYEGLIAEARRIVSMARSRYDGRLRDGLNSGPGGNPFNELECGKFYARAMSSWSLLIASQGLVLEGPQGILGFRPNWQPEDHRSFFTAPEGWGLFVQQRTANSQTERIEVRHGRLRLRKLVFALGSAATATASVTLDGQPVAATLNQSGADVELALGQETIVPEGAAIDVVLRWS